jgi:delta8-fatty-acid desaturase
MTVARFNLYAQSFILHAKCVDYMAWKKVDLASLIFFWVWYVPMLMQLGSWQRAVAYLFLSHGVCALLHIQITISHFAMPVYEGSPYKDDGYEFIKTQLATSMDVDCPWYLDWLHGGLQFQVEHHLFPRLPRHNLRYVKDKYVVPFCKKWNIQYHQATFFEANMIVLNTLRQAATKASLHSGFVASFNGDG